MALPVAALTGAARDAATAITALFTSYGLATLAPAIIGYLKAGYGADAVTMLLQETPQYKQRFIANEARRKAGMSVLTPAEYIATERAYTQVMRKHGLPAGFYDSQADFTNFLTKDVSASELDTRAGAASDFINTADKNTLAYFKQYYSNGDMIAFALDPTRAAPLVGKAFQGAEIGGAARTSGSISLDKSMADRLARDGITKEQAQQGFGQVGMDKDAAKNLSDIYDGPDVSTEDLILGLFENNASANKKKSLLASKERAAFGGTGGAHKSALSKSD